MFLNLINYALVVAASLYLLLFIMLMRQNVRMPAMRLFALVTELYFLDTLTILYILNSGYASKNEIASKIHFGLSILILAGIYYFSASFTYSRRLPRLAVPQIAVIAVGCVLAAMPLVVPVADQLIYIQGNFLPVYGPVYMIVIAGQAGLAIYLTRQQARMYAATTRVAERNPLRTLLHRVLPLMIISHLAVYVAPYFWPGFIAAFSGYLLIAIILYYSAGRFLLLEETEKTQIMLPQFSVAAIFMLVFYASLSQATTLRLVLLSIPFLVACSYFGYYLLTVFRDAIRKSQRGYHEILDQRIERFSRDVNTFLELEPLWQYLRRFCRETFDMEKIAVITLQYDVSPYQIEFVSGFDEKQLQSLLKGNPSPVLRKLETEHEIVNKFDYANRDPLYQAMDQIELYLGIPLLNKNDLIGMILLGGDHQYRPVSPRYIHLLRLMSSQIAVAVSNIHSISRLVQAEKMAGVGMFSSQLAHDFRSFIALTKTHLSENPRLARHAAYIEKLVQDLMNYVRPQELKLTAVDVNKLIDMSLDLVQIEPDVCIEKHYSTQLPEIQVDIHQMRRVFTNLLANSLRAMRNRDQKRVKISTRPLRPLSQLHQNTWIYIEILDVGNGIPEEYLDRIFDPFFTTHKTEGGNGLGLAIVKQIITRHAGFIDVSSRKGKGTIFSIRLPYQAS